MKLKPFSLILLAIGALLLIAGVVSPFVALYIYTAVNGPLNIIGGAGLPTYRFIVFDLLETWPLSLTLWGATLVGTALFCLIFTKTVQSSCCVTTTALSLTLSAIGAMGLLCVIRCGMIVGLLGMSRYPMASPVWLTIGLLSFLVFLGLFAFYLERRIGQWSCKGFCIDIVTGILYLPVFFTVFAHLFELVL